MDDPGLGRRIIILGCPGSGKSTLGRSLHGLTGLPLHHLDNIWWRADRTHISREEFDRRLQEILRGGEWIIDGDYSRTYEPRFLACDTVIFLDYDEADCLAGLAARIGTDRPDIPWAEDRPDPDLLAQVARYRRENRPALYALIGKYPDRRTLIFQTRAQMQAWLEGLQPPDGKTIV